MTLLLISPLSNLRRAVSSEERQAKCSIIRLTGVNTESKCPHPLCRIVVWDAENQREIVLLE